MNVIKRDVEEIFPTPIFVSKIDTPDFCDTLASLVLKMKEDGWGTISSFSRYTTPDDIQCHSGFKPIVDLILQESGNALDFLAIKRDAHYISNMWAHVTSPYNIHRTHTHPNSILSGILYLKCSDDSGHTIFPDPRIGPGVLEPEFLTYNRYNGGTFDIKPEKGKLVMWQSWLPHGVHPGNEEDETRIVLAFNVLIKAEIKSPTACISL